MKTAEFFSNLAAKIGYGTIAKRSGVSLPTISKLLSDARAVGPARRPQLKGVEVLAALEKLAQERAADLRAQAKREAANLNAQADEIEERLPELQAWMQELRVGQTEPVVHA